MEGVVGQSVLVLLSMEPGMEPTSAQNPRIGPDWPVGCSDLSTSDDRTEDVDLAAPLHIAQVKEIGEGGPRAFPTVVKVGANTNECIQCCPLVALTGLTSCDKLTIVYMIPHCPYCLAPCCQRGS